MKISDEKRKALLDVSTKSAIHLIELNISNLSTTAVYSRIERIAEDLRYALLQTQEE